MINYQIDVPFSIGDTVWVKKDRRVFVTLNVLFVMKGVMPNGELCQHKYRVPHVVIPLLKNGEGDYDKIANVRSKSARRTQRFI